MSQNDTHNEPMTTQFERFFRTYCGTNGCIPACNQCQEFKEACTHPENPLNKLLAEVMVGAE